MNRSIWINFTNIFLFTAAHRERRVYKGMAKTNTTTPIDFFSSVHMHTGKHTQPHVCTGKHFRRRKSRPHPQSNYFQGVHGTFPYLRKYCCINLLSHSLPSHTVCVWALKEQGFSSAKPKKWYMKRQKSCYYFRFDVRQNFHYITVRKMEKSVGNLFDMTRPRRVFWRAGKLWDIKKI